MMGPAFGNSASAPAETDASMLIDRHLPEFDVTVVRHAVVDADPETTYDAMLTADLLDTGPIVRALGRLRTAPMVVSQRLRGVSGEPEPEQLRFVDVPKTDEWLHLEDAPGEEFVFGAVGKFWQPAIEWRQLEPEAFAAFDEPGYAKLAISLSVRPDGEGRTLLSYEARTATTDDRARRNFRWYWRVIGPFAGYLMSRALERIKADAERQASRDATEPSADVDNRDRSNGPSSRRIATAMLLLVATYHFGIRPWHRRWGVPASDVQAPLPGDDLLPDATDQVTHAIEVDAPTEAVWPWLVQLGQGRGGFYSYDWLENAVGADIHTVDRIVPELQDLEEGDTIRLAPEDYPGSSPESAPTVARLDHERALVLRPPGESPAWTWAFVLEPIDEDTTRLFARMRSKPRQSSIGPFSEGSPLRAITNYLFWEPAHFVMERKMLTGIKRRAEQAKRIDSSSTA